MKLETVLERNKQYSQIEDDGVMGVEEEIAGRQNTGACSNFHDLTIVITEFAFSLILPCTNSYFSHAAAFGGCGVSRGSGQVIDALMDESNKDKHIAPVNKRIRQVHPSIPCQGFPHKRTIVQLESRFWGRGRASRENQVQHMTVVPGRVLVSLLPSRHVLY